MRRRAFCQAMVAGLAGGPTAFAQFGLVGPESLGHVLGNGKFPNFRQPDDISCGPTSGSMVLKFYGIDAGIGPLKTKAKTQFYSGPGLDGKNYRVGMTHPANLRDAIASYGVPCGMNTKASLADLKRCINDGRPCIVLARSGAGPYWHYIVIFGYSAGGSQFKVSDPSGQVYDIDASRLDKAWTFSHDLNGNDIPDPKCGVCGGDGQMTNLECANPLCKGGKVSTPFGKKRCPLGCNSGRMTSKCKVCNNGKLPDPYRKVVETIGVSGHTLIVPDRKPADRIVKIEYTLKNDAGRPVAFTMKPSGKRYTLETGKTFKGMSHEVNGTAPTITFEATNRTHKLTAGEHRIYWSKSRNRIAFDRDDN